MGCQYLEKRSIENTRAGTMEDTKIPFIKIFNFESNPIFIMVTHQNKKDEIQTI